MLAGMVFSNARDEATFSASPRSDSSAGRECSKAESSCDQRGRTQVPGLRSPRELLVSSGGTSKRESTAM